jgi:hypothetical protein
MYYIINKILSQGFPISPDFTNSTRFYVKMLVTYIHYVIITFL